MWSVLGELRELAGLLGESADAYRRAAALSAADPVATAELLARRARVHERAGAYVTALRVVTRARRPASTGCDDEAARRTRVRLDALTALVRLGQERPREARALGAAGGRRRPCGPTTPRPSSRR